MRIKHFVYAFSFFGTLILALTFFASVANAQTLNLEFDGCSVGSCSVSSQLLTSNYVTWVTTDFDTPFSIDSEDISHVDFLLAENDTLTSLDFTCDSNSSYNITLPLTETNDTELLLGYTFEYFRFDYYLLDDNCTQWTTNSVLDYTTRKQRFSPVPTNYPFEFNHTGGHNYYMSVRLYSGGEPLPPPPFEPYLIENIIYDENLSTTTCNYGNGSSTCEYFYSTSTSTNPYTTPLDGLYLMFGLFLLLFGVQTWYTIINKLS